MVAATLLENRSDSDEATKGRPTDALRFFTDVGESSSHPTWGEWELFVVSHFSSSAFSDRFDFAIDSSLASIVDVRSDADAFVRALEFEQTTEGEDTPDLRSERPDAAEVERSVNVLGEILGSVFGSTAYVVPLAEIDPESGQTENVLEAHYCFGGGEGELEDLVELHERFLRKYVTEAPHWLRKRWVLRWVASDDD